MLHGNPSPKAYRRAYRYLAREKRDRLETTYAKRCAAAAGPGGVSLQPTPVPVIPARLRRRSPSREPASPIAAIR